MTKFHETDFERGEERKRDLDRLEVNTFTTICQGCWGRRGVIRGRSSHGLTEQAMRAVKRFRYQPAEHRGQPVPTRVEVAIRFTL